MKKVVIDKKKSSNKRFFSEPPKMDEINVFEWYWEKRGLHIAQGCWRFRGESLYEGFYWLECIDVRLTSG
jgi:hypothetical protein